MTCLHNQHTKHQIIWQSPLKAIFMIRVNPQTLSVFDRQGRAGVGWVGMGALLICPMSRSIFLNCTQGHWLHWHMHHFCRKQVPNEIFLHNQNNCLRVGRKYVNAPAGILWAEDLLLVPTRLEQDLLFPQKGSTSYDGETQTVTLPEPIY